ncbi:MBL fold metallo-hydrolase [Ferrovum sp.]|uniref:MBL fold metallo-hydrolase n=1 Tax=Ferrovum sp. TaxID=2609467 RepID=UPI0026055EB4|nr:MBL fold metallo-hydrolase [Ferrovum sp.]
MALRFSSLGSGSEGNGLLVQSAQTLILVDCGFSLVETERRLNRLGVCSAQLDALLVTHEHSDHMSGIPALAKRVGCPVYGSFGTLVDLIQEIPEQIRVIRDEESFAVGPMNILPYAVPHDSREPLQYVFSAGDRRFGLLTDTGSVTPHIERSLQGCHALFLETNYDPELLEKGPYPASLKARVQGPYGHLSNEASSRLAQRLDHHGLQWIVAAHISRKNNTPDHALTELNRVLRNGSDRILIAAQDTGLDWISLGVCL